jgi:hypothetical protein
MLADKCISYDEANDGRDINDQKLVLDTAAEYASNDTKSATS